MNMYASTSPQVEEREIRHLEISRKMATECIVLLENDGTLPVGPGKVALFGNGARVTIKGGTGSGDVNTRTNVSVESGLKNAGFIITTENWMNRQEQHLRKARENYQKWCREEAQKQGRTELNIMFDVPFTEPDPEKIHPEDIENAQTDTAIYVISRISGEGADRFDAPGDYQLHTQEYANIAYLSEHMSKVIVVLNVGGIIDMKWAREISGINAVILMNQLGNTGGDALADVLTGKVTPSGKTVNTWAENYMDYPSSARFSHNESVDDEYYEDGIFIGYRYFDSFEKKPVYPFGYGLSYTNFEIKTQQVTITDSKIHIQAEVTNTGENYAGKEVIQVYYSAPQEGLYKPYQELLTFDKTKLLAPGESQKMSLIADVRDMASYDEKAAAWVLEKGSYLLRIGNSSANTKPAACIEIPSAIFVSMHKNLFALDCDLQEIKPKNDQMASKAIEDMPEKLPQIRFEGAVNTDRMIYAGQRQEMQSDTTEALTLSDVKEGKCNVEELTAQLSIEEMAELCVGTLRAQSGQAVGDSSYLVPGAAGDTSAVLEKTRGIKGMIMADGPAGIRLVPHFRADENGRILPADDDSVFSQLMESQNKDTEKSENIQDYYQYCTAIPIGWALASSWNLKMIEETGDMIGSEMEQFGIDLWLAPALNIHRNPLCGRNFEYYSEDPLIAGKVSAAITKGVQKHKGKGTTIKHFAVNNQEDNRYFLNAHVSERALREIYLKGFEIAVKESQPVALMTSYNLLNGIHTANSYDLIQAALRDEWGFQGMVMTDWFTSQYIPEIVAKYEPKYPISASSGCIFAGNDVQMPGCSKNVDDIVKAVKSGEEVDGYQITLADLQFNASNVIRAVLKTSECEDRNHK